MDIASRINQALAREEIRAEKLANVVRLIFLIALTIIALLNSSSVSFEANILNFGALSAGFMYGFLVSVRIRRQGYRPMMKYITSCLDVGMIFLLLFTYSRIEIPAVALKNYTFLVVFPVVALTAFRYDRRLTLVSGGLAIMLYTILIFQLTTSGFVSLTNGGYEQELFSPAVTTIGQLTKVLILTGYVLLLAHLAHYSRKLFAKVISTEVVARTQKETMDLEMKIASQVQTNFLPQSIPVVAELDIFSAIQQGRYVGGDYYDIIPMKGEKLLIISADVSGKGIPAALVMAEVRAAAHVLASQHAGLEEMVQRLNTLLHQSTDRKSFVTFFAGEIDTHERRMTYINAGHPPPLLSTVGKVHPLAKGTVPLGMLTSLPQLTMHTQQLTPGDLLVSYTDGIVERTNHNREQYGVERLVGYVQANGHLGVRSFTQQLFNEVKGFGEGRDLDDDVTLLVVRYVPGNAPSTAWRST
jgi:serine phosphatase RsbU (regulator of sigma subunit)